MRRQHSDVVVVGAGVTGLTTAICLSESDLTVTIRAAEPPRQTASAAAGAMCGATTTGPSDPATRWAQIAAAEFRALAHQEITGVHLTRGRLVSNSDNALPPFPTSATHLTPCEGDESSGFRTAFWTELPIVDMPRYLNYLEGRFVAAGGRIDITHVTDLGAAASESSIVVNCTGIGSHDLVPDPEVRPEKGQHVIVENPGLDTFIYEEGAESSWVALFPHGNRVVLGSVAIKDVWDLAPIPEITNKILDRCTRVEPRLAGCRILGVDVGLRPGRPTVRLEEEYLKSTLCVHNYGHGGVGVSLSWGCARDVVEMVQRRR